MIQAPVVSVTAVRTDPVSVCVAVTVTPGSTAPLSSVTFPLSCAVPCAQAMRVARSRPIATNEELRREHFIPAYIRLTILVVNAAGRLRFPKTHCRCTNGSMNDRKPEIRTAGLGDLDALVAGNLALAEETERVRLDADTLRQGIRALLESRAPGRYSVAEVQGR